MTLLNVPFAEKEQAKSLGARWNPYERKWYVPEELINQLDDFTHWLPSANPTNQFAPSSFNLNSLNNTNDTTGISLSQLMGSIQHSIRQSFPGAVWVQAEIANINERRGHLYFELSEMNKNGQAIATCRAMIWQSQAQRITEQFKLATGSSLQDGQKILLLIEVTFHEKFGLSLSIQDIDPAFTLGELEANLNQIRQQLIKDNLYDLNKQKTHPKDFFRVAVIAPPAAAGLGDFRVDADLLQSQNLCEFHYFYASFQGDKVEPEMLAAFQVFQALHKASAFDALVIIRGGGAKLDLNPLNIYSLAKWISQANLPVLTGIGHEKDNTILDEVACIKFDTPSKVIANIRQTIFLASQQAKQNWLIIEKSCLNYLQNQKQTLFFNHQKVNQASLLLIHQQKQSLNPLIINIQQQSKSLLEMHKKTIEQYKNTINLQISSKLYLQKQVLEQYKDIVEKRPIYLVNQAKKQTKQQISYILSSGIKTQLNRGFSLVKNAKQQPITSASKAIAEDSLQIHFKDGSVKVNPIKLIKED